ncbi:S8 family serine peptidase [Deinococcus gobiensis]|uniref:Serine protease, subtilase family n=1 Tax=Deinococcus gobiensis (strain DSM 21396 / JCM 16679 / CGMCC 1.7299 / I-0) TaxID=745776 RepID=H8GTR7_DEIGI|nr:S8 family serine peptidase [Deinococcus gobiensis]AFD25395.1 Serine protease, subtilase family [Deinococcus gobiensis I-0]
MKPSAPRPNAPRPRSPRAGFLAATLALATLSACGQLNPPLQPQTVFLGQAASASAQQAFSGTWAVKDVPSWLTVSPASGSGPVNLTVSADRAAGTPLNADQRTLSGSFQITWTLPDKTAGSATWTVQADQFRLSGRVVDAARLNGADARLGDAALGAGTAGGSRGVIVTYREAGVRDAVLAARGSVRAQAQANAAVARATLDRLGVSAGARSPLGNRAALLDTPASASALAALRADPNVLTAVPNVTLHALATPAAPLTPTDQYAPLQWAYPLLGYGAVWRDMESGGYTKAVTVAVVDTGVRYDHPDLAGQLYGPDDGALDVITTVGNGDGDGADTDPTDPSVAGRTLGSHGTHVTGIIAARWGQNTATCAGCSPTGVVGATYRAPVKVLPIRALDSSGDTTAADVANAVRYAAGLSITLDGKTFTNPHPAQVINLSLGGAVSAAEGQPMCDAIADAHARGALVVAAAGNDGTTLPFYPAACAGAVSVASVTLSGGSAPKHAVYSNAYPQVQLSAPGGASYLARTTFNGAVLGGSPFPDEIFSTGWDYVRNQPNYEAESGTSQAAPQVSALAALLLSKGVTSGPDDTLARMVATATDLGAAGRDDLFGSGMINAAAALNAPVVSDTLGLRLQDDQGRAFQPPLDALGRFTAYLGDGSYSVVAGRDRNGNGVYGESGEPRTERRVTLGTAAPATDLGDLTPTP